METLSTQLLTADQIQQKVNRMAIEIYERNSNQTQVIIAGIEGMGYQFAQRLATAVADLTSLTVDLLKVTVDKRNPIGKRAVLENEATLQPNATVIVVDDVLNSGRTLMHALEPFLGTPLNVLQTAVLIDRNHPTYPVRADYVGKVLATTLQEHINVVLGEDGEGVYLV